MMLLRGGGGGKETDLPTKSAEASVAITTLATLKFFGIFGVMASLAPSESAHAALQSQHRLQA
jgi:hypothetical protein